MLLNPGDKLGPYQIIEPIGKGGMGEVYRGTDTRLDRPVAIKVSAREFNDRFEREARAISALNHPNICTLHDIGPNYLVMEYIEGETLSRLIERGPLPLEKALAYAVQTAGALAAAHAKGIVHRDLKPGNIIVTRNGVKVLDFGLAKLSHQKTTGESAANVETVTEPLTRAGAVLGTLYYMAPEQVEGKEADDRSDIFSFGVVLYESHASLHYHITYDITCETAATPCWQSQLARLLQFDAVLSRTERLGRRAYWLVSRVFPGISGHAVAGMIKDSSVRSSAAPK
jgi:serine/threonine protein kinase